MSPAPTSTRPPFCLALLSLSASLFATACSSSPLGTMGGGDPLAANTTVSGAVTGKFQSAVSAIYNQKSTRNLTVFHISSGAVPPLGIDFFSFDALLPGMPLGGHHYGKEASLHAEIDVSGDGFVRFFNDTVNSQLRVDLTPGGVSDPMAQPDGAAAYTVHGVAAGILGADTGEVINFSVAF
jgi:hypothetical protein